MSPANPDDPNSHVDQMKHRKGLVDAAVRAAQESRGVLILLTGNGKGKSSSAFGMVSRSLGHGFATGIVQFIKGPWMTGEQRFLQGIPGVEFVATGEGFTWDTQDRDRDIRAARSGWERAAQMLSNERYRLVVLDELTYLFHYGYLELAPVLDALKGRPLHQNVIITGRHAVPELVELADTVSEINDRKHAFNAGIKAQKGIEY